MLHVCMNKSVKHRKGSCNGTQHCNVSPSDYESNKEIRVSLHTSYYYYYYSTANITIKCPSNSKCSSRGEFAAYLVLVRSTRWQRIAMHALQQHW